MKVLLSVLVVFGFSAANAYEDYQYEKLADCVAADNKDINIVVETEPGNLANVTINLYDSSLPFLSKFTFMSAGSTRDLEFQSMKKVFGQPTVSGSVEYCGSYCAQDKGKFKLIFDDGTVRNITLLCKKLY